VCLLLSFPDLCAQLVLFRSSFVAFLKIKLLLSLSLCNLLTFITAKQARRSIYDIMTINISHSAFIGILKSINIR